MTWSRLGRQLRAIRLRLGLRQADVAARASVSRSAVSLVERGLVERLSVSVVQAVIHALDARLEPRLLWHGPDLDRLMDAGHAALSAAVKRRLESWGWLVRVEVSYNHYGDRGRIDLLAWHSARRVVLVIEIKTSLADVQALLGSLDVKTRIAVKLATRFGWQVDRVLPAIVFSEDRSTRRHVFQLEGLFDRYNLRGRTAITWLRGTTADDRSLSGLMWFAKLSNACVVRISGQRVRKPAVRRPDRAWGGTPATAARR